MFTFNTLGTDWAGNATYSDKMRGNFILFAVALIIGGLDVFNVLKIDGSAAPVDQVPQTKLECTSASAN